MDFVAKQLKLDYGVPSRVLSVVPLVRVRDGDEWKDGGDLGLQLKLVKRNLGMPGFTQRHPNGKGLQVSVATVQILTQYREQCPEVFTALKKYRKDFELDPAKVCPGQDAKVAQVQKFLSQPDRQTALGPSIGTPLRRGDHQGSGGARGQVHSGAEGSEVHPCAQEGLAKGGKATGTFGRGTNRRSA
jgi:hypothetical protein